MSDLRLGLIGLGNWGNRLARAVAQIDGLELGSCFSPSEQRRDTFSREHAVESSPSLVALLESDLDGILVATPHSTHRDLVVAAAEAGMHVMVEKPLSLSADDARQCVRAAAEHGVILHVAHYRRRLTATRMLKAAIDAGELGTVLQVEGRFNRPLGPDTARPWRDDPTESPAGAMTALGIHMVDNFLYLVGPVRRVTAITARPLAVTALDDVTIGLFEFENGCVGTLSTSLRLPFESSCAVYGTEAVAWSEADGSRYFVQHRNETSRTEVTVTPVDGVVANLEAFASCVRSGVESDTGGAAGLEVVRVMEAMSRSASQGGSAIDLGDV